MNVPNPIQLPASLQTVMWAKWPTQFFSYYASRLPDPFTMRLIGNRTYVIVSHPDGIKEIFTRFSDPGNEELRTFLGSNSLFLLQGDKHASHRRVIQPLFMSDSTNLYAQRIQTTTERAAHRLARGETVCIPRLIGDTVIEIMSDIMFGIEDGTDAAEVASLLRELLGMMSGPRVYFEVLQKDWGQFSVGRKMRNLISGIEQRVRMQTGCPVSKARSILTGLVTPSNGVPFSEQEVVDEVKTLLGAGADPTAAAVAWAIYFIHANPEVLERVLQELRDNAAKAIDPVAIGANDDSYLDLVCRETLRLIPVEPTVDRQVVEPIMFMGYKINPGVRLVACPLLTHRRPDIYENPLSFIPERFAKRTYSPFEYYPFGGARRRCVAAYFATFQMKIMVATLLSIVEFARPYKGRVDVHQRGVTLWPSRKFRMKVERVRKG